MPVQSTPFVELAQLPLIQQRYQPFRAPAGENRPLGPSPGVGAGAATTPGGDPREPGFLGELFGLSSEESNEWRAGLLGGANQVMNMPNRGGGVMDILGLLGRAGAGIGSGISKERTDAGARSVAAEKAALEAAYKTAMTGKAEAETAQIGPAADLAQKVYESSDAARKSTAKYNEAMARKADADTAAQKAAFDLQQTVVNSLMPGSAGAGPPAVGPAAPAGPPASPARPPGGPSFGPSLGMQTAAGDAVPVPVAGGGGPTIPGAAPTGTGPFSPAAAPIGATPPAPPPEAPTGSGFSFGGINDMTDSERAIVATNAAEGNTAAGLKAVRDQRYKTSKDVADKEFNVSKENASRANEYRDEFNKAAEPFQTVSTMVQNMHAADPTTGAGQLNIIYSMIKVLDPESVVREGEVRLSREASPILRQIMNYPAKVSEGQLLDPTTIQQMIAEADKIVAQKQVGFAQLFDRYKSMSVRNGINPEDVVFDARLGMAEVAAKTVEEDTVPRPSMEERFGVE